MADDATKHVSTLTIKVPDGIPQHAVILLNGQPIPGLSLLSLKMTPDQLLVVTLEVGVELDAELAVVERILESLPPPA